MCNDLSMSDSYLVVTTKLLRTKQQLYLVSCLVGKAFSIYGKLWGDIKNLHLHNSVLRNGTCRVWSQKKCHIFKKVFTASADLGQHLKFADKVFKKNTCICCSTVVLHPY